MEPLREAPARHRWPRLADAVAVVSLWLATGCSTVLGIDDLVADRDPSSGTGGALCAGACGTPGCGSCPGAPKVDASSPAGAYLVDAYEVTVGRYRAWLDTKPSLATQRSECSWNDSYAPGVASQSVIDASEEAGVPYEVEPECLGEPLEDERPQACVDWCDAAAYCAWTGGRLCGAFGGGTIDVTDGPGPHADPAESEWHQACTAGGTLAYPYGGAFETEVCNDVGNGLRDVGSFEGCNGGYPGLFDMSGNVAEWEDACTDFSNVDALQNCLVRGGTWYNTADAERLACAAFRDVPRAGLSASFGFRCCFDG